MKNLIQSIKMLIWQYGLFGLFVVTTYTVIVPYSGFRDLLVPYSRIVSTFYGVMIHMRHEPMTESHDPLK